MPDDRDNQQARQQDLDAGDEGPHTGAADGGVADLLGGPAVAVEEELLAADAAQDAQARDGVGGQLGGAARLLALEVGTPCRARQQRQHGECEDGDTDGDDDAERGLVDDQADTDQHHGEGRRGEPGDGLDEPADPLDVARGDRDDLTGRHPPRQRRAELGRLARQQLLDARGRGDPVGDRRPVQEGVAQRDGEPAQHQQHAREGEPGAGAVDHGLDGGADAERESGHGGEVQQPPCQRLELSA